MFIILSTYFFDYVSLNLSFQWSIFGLYCKLFVLLSFFFSWDSMQILSQFASIPFYLFISFFFFFTSLISVFYVFYGVICIFFSVTLLPIFLYFCDNFIIFLPLYSWIYILSLPIDSWSLFWSLKYLFHALSSKRVLLGWAFSISGENFICYSRPFFCLIVFVRYSYLFPLVCLLLFLVVYFLWPWWSFPFFHCSF